MSKKSNSPEARAKRICRGKETFKTLPDAAIRQGAAWVHNKMFLRPYECQICGLWHLTSGEK